MSSSRETRSRTLTGIAAAPGLAAGPAAVWRDQTVTVPRNSGRQPATETARLTAARAAARDEIRRLRAKVAAEAGQAEAAIFDAHEMFLDDTALLQHAQQAIETGVNAEAAWADAIEFFAAQLEQLPDPTLRARAADVRDVGGRVLDHLLGRRTAGVQLDVPSIVVARDLAPSQIASFPVARVLAFCTAEGGPTSHTAILAKAWGKPAVVGLGKAVLELSDGTLVQVDGTRGEVVVDPDEQTARAIRISLQRPELLAVQLRALLRASPGHDLRIMFPMIASPEELRAAKAELERARRDVASAGHPVAISLQVGMMVEVPSAAVLADQFAREADFFSIGTNDLTQYTLAADRTHERVAYLSDACHPAVLRQIRSVVQAAHAAGRWVGVCGELAGDPDAVPLLLGLDLDELSMAPVAIPAAKAIIRRWSWGDAQQLAARALDVDSAMAVRNLVRASPPA